MIWLYYAGSFQTLCRLGLREGVGEVADFSPSAVVFPSIDTDYRSASHEALCETGRNRFLLVVLRRLMHRLINNGRGSSHNETFVASWKRSQALSRCGSCVRIFLLLPLLIPAPRLRSLRSSLLLRRTVAFPLLPRRVRVCPRVYV